MLAKSGKPEGASSLSSLPHMGSQGTVTVNNQNQSARSGADPNRPGFQPGMSSIRAQILAEMQPPPKDEDQDRLLDIESKVQMFKITVDKINKSKKTKV